MFTYYTIDCIYHNLFKQKLIFKKVNDTKYWEGKTENMSIYMYIHIYKHIHTHETLSE